MTDRPGRRVLLFALTILTLFRVTAAGAEEAMPVKLDTPAFSVRMTDGEGLERDFFGQGNPAYFDISFALSLSAANRFDRFLMWSCFPGDFQGECFRPFKRCRSLGKR